jgi:hypothetical protein
MTNHKLEARNPKLETNTKIQIERLKMVRKFQPLSLGFVSDFDIRISDLN